jgi:hypothetical protein
LIEGLRVDSLYWGSIRVSQLLAAVSFLGAAAVLAVLAFRPHDPGKLFVNRDAVLEQETPEEEETGEEPENTEE